MFIALSVVTWQVAAISHYPPRKMLSIVNSVEERLQLSVEDFRKLTWLEWLSLLHSDLAESELGCVQFHACHFIGRNVAVFSLSQTYNDAKEHKIIILSLSFKDVPASIADEKHCDANCILLLAILGIERIVLHCLLQFWSNQAVVEIFCHSLYFFLHLPSTYYVRILVLSFA